MSFILDALKKSEAERQRQNVPGLLDQGPAMPRPRFPAWGIWLGLLLGVNLLVLLVVLLRGWVPGGTHAITAATAVTNPVVRAPTEPTAPPPTMATPVLAATPVAAADDKSFSPMDGSPVYAPEIPVTEFAAPATATVQRPDPRIAKALYPPDPDEVLPTLSEVNLSGNRGVPELHMDIHVYAAKPSQRFVFFNNRKYREGETLQEGPSVERITREGVVLRFQGLRFSVPRQ